MRLPHRFAAPAAIFLFCLAALPGCANFATTTSGSTQLDIQATSHSIYEGEIVTVTTRTINALGTGAKLEWSSTGGDLSTESNDRIARVKFDKPGTFTISAKLVADGRVLDEDHVDVQVRQLIDADTHD